PYLGGNDYSIADIATYTWARYHDTHHIDLADYPAVEKWLNTISQRPAAKKLFG
ncbi:glutathione S-transferase family protein, partial [Proteus mirabilis]|nr:glutathione S-transferase family protein [Proteus mirabilis]